VIVPRTVATAALARSHPPKFNNVDPILPINILSLKTDVNDPQ
jgi:hypothetical protein